MVQHFYIHVLKGMCGRRRRRSYDLARSAANEYAQDLGAEMMTVMSSSWEIRAEVAVGGLTAVGFVPGSSLVLVVSHQGRGVVDFISGERVARDRRERVPV